MRAKATLLGLLVCSNINGWGQQQTSGNSSGGDSNKGSPTPQYQVTERGANHRVWSTVSWTTNRAGIVTIHTNTAYTELATGLHHLVNGQWVASSEQLELTALGAQGTNAAHTVTFLGNANSLGAVTVTTPDGEQLTSEVLGLSYFDRGSGESVMIGEIKDCQGELLPSGAEVMYPDAFSGVKADLYYINQLSGLEQFAILRGQLPPPSAWGLNPSNTVLELITEFVNAPQPHIGNQTMAGAADECLGFGVMQMGHGYAFAFGEETNKVPVIKEWLLMEGRTCLVEQVPFTEIQQTLSELPPASSGGAKLQSSPDSILNHLAIRQLLPPQRRARKGTTGFLLAKGDAKKAGFALDYSLLTSQTNLVLQADTTYLVSGSINVSGEVVVEGGAVVKYTNSSTASISASNIVCKTAAYHPAVFTAMDDNTIGGTIAGSTGNPTNYYGNTALDLSSADNTPSEPGGGLALSNLRFCYLSNALCGVGLALTNSQMEKCNTGFRLANLAAQCLPGLYNVLLDQVNTVVGTRHSGDNDNVVAVNVTAHRCAKFLGDLDSEVAYTNCLFALVTNWQGTTVYTNNSFFLNSDTGVFQTVGAASHYLADGSLYRNVGTTNIDAGTLAAITQRTTYPPIVYSNVTFATNVTFTSQAQRDTDVPDVGYHYDPLDYAFQSVVFTNALIQFQPGTAIGAFGSYGTTIAGGTQLISQGAPTTLNYFARYNMVQECSNTNWAGAGDIVRGNFKGGAITPQATFHFTVFSQPALDGNSLINTYNDTVFIANDSQFLGGQVNIEAYNFSFTNCLFERVQMLITDNNSSMYPTVRNCLFHYGSLYLDDFNGTTWTFRDNLFDHASITELDTTVDGAYNGYLTGSSRVTTNANDVVTNIVYQMGPLGNYYQPTNSPFINAGSTTANLVGLFHYTTQTNQVKEANSTVDIGFHYVAVDGYGDPIDTDGDGIPDYLADPNGNGLLDVGEIPFGITIDNPISGSVIR